MRKSTIRKLPYSFFSYHKFLFLCFLFLSLTIHTNILTSQGFFVLDEVTSSFLNEGDRNDILCIHDGYLYLNVWNYSGFGDVNFIRIIDVQQPDTPLIVGSIEFNISAHHGGKSLVDFVISGNMAYMLMELWILSRTRYFLTLVNITDPTNPVILGSSGLTDPYLWEVPYTEIVSVHDNYAYVSGLTDLHIFDCTNHSFPVKVGEFDSPGADIHTTNNFLYLMHDGVRVYSLTDPANPVLVGELDSVKNSSVGSGVCGNFVINVFRESGLQSYDCTDPSHPILCKDYTIPSWKIGVRGIVHDIAIVGDRLFAGGDRLYIFNIRKPQNSKRIAWLDLSDHNITHIVVADNYLYMKIPDNYTIYSYIETSLERNIGIGVGIGLSLIIGVIIFIRRKKKRS